jgi:hypothetical protein
LRIENSSLKRTGDNGGILESQPLKKSKGPPSQVGEEASPLEASYTEYMNISTLAKKQYDTVVESAHKVQSLFDENLMLKKEIDEKNAIIAGKDILIANQSNIVEERNAALKKIEGLSDFYATLKKEEEDLRGEITTLKKERDNDAANMASYRQQLEKIFHLVPRS